MQGDEVGRAMRARVEQAWRHAAALREQALEQRAMARRQLASEQDAIEAARALVPDSPRLSCGHCGAVWDNDALRSAVRRQPVCPLCAGPLSPLAAD